MDIINILKDELGIKRTQAETAVKLIDEGNTRSILQRASGRRGWSLMMCDRGECCGITVPCRSRTF